MFRNNYELGIKMTILDKIIAFKKKEVANIKFEDVLKELENRKYQSGIEEKNNRK